MGWILGQHELWSLYQKKNRHAVFCFWRKNNTHITVPMQKAAKPEMLLVFSRALAVISQNLSCRVQSEREEFVKGQWRRLWKVGV
jgi:hypothetical protein